MVLLGLLAVAPLAGVSTARFLEASVTGDLQAADVDLRQGFILLEAGYRNQDAAKVQAAQARFARSRDQLQALSRRLRPLDPARGSTAPGWVRSRVATLDALIDVVTHVDQAGMTGAQVLEASGLVGGPAVGGPAVGGPAAGDPAPTSQLMDLLGSIRDDLATASRLAGSIDLSVLPARQQVRVQKALDDLRTAESGLDALWPSLVAVLGVLGLDGPKTYLIEQVNPAELRAGGGFIGTVSLVHADRGRVTLATSLPVEAFDYCDADGCVHPRPERWQPGYVAPPAELAGFPLPSYSRLTAWSLEDSGFYPDFASNATTAELFARRLLDTPVDGVVAVDYYAVAPLLELTGPVALPQYGLTLTAENFVDTVVGLDLARTYTHKDVISAAAGQIVAGLSHLPPADLPRLVRIVADMVRARHLQVHFNSADADRAAARLGATDLLNPLGSSDFLLETEDNYGGSKANYFLQRRFRLVLTRSGAALHHSLTVDLHDGAPADRPWIGPDYYAYLRVTVPAEATHITLSSARSAEYAPIQPPASRTQVPPAGAQVAGGWIFVLVGQGLTGDYEATFTWDTPWRPAAGGSASLYWQKQPGTVADPLEVTWASGAGTVSAVSDLGQDRLVTVGPRGLTIEPAPA